MKNSLELIDLSIIKLVLVRFPPVVTLLTGSIRDHPYWTVGKTARTDRTIQYFK
jgi:hypothetical protein